MNNTLIIFIMTFILSSCNKKIELEKFDKDGKLIVYSQKVYTEISLKNQHLKVTVIDTFCINQKSRAIKDIKNGKLIYFGFGNYEFKKLSKKLSKYGIETKEHIASCIRIGSFKPYCYEDEMLSEIHRKYGENFIDSICEVAKKEFVVENPDIEYIENGNDLRNKYNTKIH